jgi:hypothetical protein
LEAQPNQVHLQRTIRETTGFIISHRGIEANMEKITAITDMRAPQTIKDVQ